MEQPEWEKLTSEEKKSELYYRQKALLDQFLKTGAISKEQHDKSLEDMTAKMGIKLSSKDK